MSDTNVKSAKKHTGACHCGAIRFEVEVDLDAGASRCNCTVCTKLGVLSAIAKPAGLKILAGESELSSYEWGGRTAKRFFCKHCGAHCFARGHLEEMGGDYASINVNCLEGVEPSKVKTIHWDGRHDNWQAGPRETPWLISASA